MATLHVRNVPDSLYEALRGSAEQNGRSIGAQTIALLNETLSTGRRGFPFYGLGSRGTATPMQAFGDAARSAIVDAQVLARELGHECVGGEDVLMGLLANPIARMSQVLGAPPHGLTPEALRERVERGPGAPAGAIPFTDEAKRGLELALREALQTRSATIEPHHLLLGLAGAGGVAADLLSGFGLDVGTLRTLVLTSGFRAPTVPRFRVVELEGSAGAWEEQLEEAASGPYELVEIVGTRAILQLARR